VIKDDGSGFAIDVAPPNAVVCVVVPADQFDASLCNGIDPGPIRAAIAKGQTAQKVAVAVATVRRVEGFSYDVMALRQQYARAGSMTPQQLDGFVRAAIKGVHDQTHQDIGATAFDGSAPQARETNGMNTLAMILAPKVASAMPIRVVSWSFFADDQIVTLSYVTDATHVDAVRADSEAIAKTIDWPAAKKTATKSTFAKPRDASGAGTQIVVGVGVVAALVGAVMLFGRRKKKAKSERGA
jgi:hypothetical protein